MHWRKSPGGRMRYSARSLPELPPSSATVTIAVRLPVYFFSPRSMVERPVPAREEGAEDGLGQLVQGVADEAETEESEEDGSVTAGDELEGEWADKLGEAPVLVKVTQKVANPEADDDQADRQKDEPSLDME